MKGDGDHVITAWGYSVDDDNPDTITGLYLTNFDDDINQRDPPNRLYHRGVVYNQGEKRWEILNEDGSFYRYIEFVYGLNRK